MEYLPYEHFRAFASQLMTRFRTQEHLECLLVMFRHAASLRVEYFIEDEHFLLSLTKVLCIRSSAVFVREAPEVRAMHLLSLFLFSDYFFSKVATRLSNFVHRVLLKGNDSFYMFDSEDEEDV